MRRRVHGDKSKTDAREESDSPDPGDEAHKAFPLQTLAGALLGIALLIACWSIIAPVIQQRQGGFQPFALRERTSAIDAAGVAGLDTADLDGMSTTWWGDLRMQHMALLRSADEHLREQALHNIIFFSETYSDKISFAQSADPIYKIYRSDPNEEHRLLALQALCALGDEAVLQRVREAVSQEKSERVRRHTLLALANYYKNRRLP